MSQVGVPGADGVSVSVIIPARNRLPLLRYLLESLRCGHADPQDFEIIVVDDASSDGTDRWLDGYQPFCAWSVLRHHTPKGRAQARNAGLRAASGEIALFLDADVLAPPHLIDGHRELHRQWPGPCCVTGHPWFWREVRTWRFTAGDGGEGAGPLLDPMLIGDWAALEHWAGGPLAPPGAAWRQAAPEAAPFLWCVTRAVSARRAVLLELGGFYERFVGYGLEDWELGYRLSQRGVSILASPRAAVFHQAHPPADRGPRDLYRNYAVFLELHPDAAIGLMALVPPWSEPEAYIRLCRGLASLRRAAPTLYGGLEEAAVAYGRSWAEGEGRPGPRQGWSGWTARWGPRRVRRMLDEWARILGYGAARPALVAFQRVVGL